MRFALGVFGAIVGYAFIWVGRNNLQYKGGLTVIDALMGTYNAQGGDGGLTTVTPAPNLTGNTPQTGGAGGGGRVFTNVN